MNNFITKLINYILDMIIKMAWMIIEDNEARLFSKYCSNKNADFIEKMINKKYRSSNVNGFSELFNDLGDYIPPLHSAIRGKNYEVVKLLLEFGACPNLIFENDECEIFISLILAIDNNDLNMIKLLVNFGANFSVNSITLACEKGYTDIVEYMLNMIGENYDKKIDFLRNGLCSASINGNIDIIDLYF